MRGTSVNTIEKIYLLKVENKGKVRHLHSGGTVYSVHTKIYIFFELLENMRSLKNIYHTLFAVVFQVSVLNNQLLASFYELERTNFSFRTVHLKVHIVTFPNFHDWQNQTYALGDFCDN